MRGDRVRDPLRFVDSVQRVIDLEPELLLTGHFGPIAGADVIRAELERVRDATQWVHDRTVEAMNDKWDVSRAMREVRLPDHLSVGEGYGKVAWDVRAIWESYAGWFHHRSTTELYGVPASSVADDLVAMCGAEALVARAIAYVDDGRPLEAVHLMEVLVDGGAADSEVWRCWAAAHRVLLEQSGEENFWEVGWLRHQVARGERKAAE